MDLASGAISTPTNTPNKIKWTKNVQPAAFTVIAMEVSNSAKLDKIRGGLKRELG